VRECMKLVAAAELRQRVFFDFVVRLRDDAFLFAEWRLAPELYADAVADIAEGSWGGLNDHAFVVDRAHAEAMLRGPLEDYFLHTAVTGTHWGINEQLLGRVAREYRIRVATLSVCQLPQISLRGLRNATHWRVQDKYAHKYTVGGANGAACDPLGVLTSRLAPVGHPDSLRVAEVATPGAPRPPPTLLPGL